MQHGCLSERLNAEERGILESFDRGELRRIAEVEGELEDARRAARATFRKARRVNLRVTERDFDLAHARAREALATLTRGRIATAPDAHEPKALGDPAEAGGFTAVSVRKRSTNGSIPSDLSHFSGCPWGNETDWDALARRLSHFRRLSVPDPPSRPSRVDVPGPAPASLDAHLSRLPERLKQPHDLLAVEPGDPPQVPVRQRTEVVVGSVGQNG